MFEPVTKWNQRVELAGAVPEIVRKAFRVAQLEKPGPTHIELPENLRRDAPSPDDLRRIEPNQAYFPEPTDEAIEHAARLHRRLDAAARPGRQRRAAPERGGRAARVRPGPPHPGRGDIHGQGRDRRPQPPVADGGRAAGARSRAVRLRSRRPRHLGRVRPGRVRAVALEPGRRASGSSTSTPSRPRWTPTTSPRSSSIGDIDGTLRRLLAAVLPEGVGGRQRQRAARGPRDARPPGPARRRSSATCCAYESRRRLADQAAEGDRRPAPRARPGATSSSATSARTRSGSPASTRRTSRTRSSSRTVSRPWGSRCPGRSRPSSSIPDRRVVALCGDGGFLMNSQELETARRIGANVTVVVWRDDGYGLIDWKQRTEFGRPFGVEFGNPDFVAYAQSFGLAAFRPSSADELYPTPDAGPRARRSVARRGPHRLPREPPPHRTPRRPLLDALRTAPPGRQVVGAFGFFGFGGRFGVLSPIFPLLLKVDAMSAARADPNHSRLRCGIE